jgi:cell division protein FtsI (penicillin-binding protein 3)
MQTCPRHERGRAPVRTCTGAAPVPFLPALTFLGLVVPAVGCGAAPIGPPQSRTTADSALAPSPSPALAGDRIERIAGEEVARFATEWSASRAVVVVVDPKSGAVRGTGGWSHGHADPSLASEHAWVTGSTLKPITISAAIDASTIAPDQRFPCGTRAYGANTLQDAAEGPCAPLDARGVIARSSNVGTSYVFDTLGSARLLGWLETLHLGDAPGTRPKIDDLKGFRAAEFAAGEVAEATPLQVARAYAAIFNDGVYATSSREGAPPTFTRVMKAETAKTIVAMLENVVEGDGNGKLARVEGARVAGKTGTADVTGESGADMSYVSFVGTVLDREPRFVALVGLEVPEGKATGPTAAAPAWAQIAARIVGER